MSETKYPPCLVYDGSIYTNIEEKFVENDDTLAFIAIYRIFVTDENNIDATNKPDESRAIILPALVFDGDVLETILGPGYIVDWFVEVALSIETNERSVVTGGTIKMLQDIKTNAVFVSVSRDEE